MEYSRRWLLLLVVALALTAIVAEATMVHELHGLPAATHGAGLIEDANEFLMDSESSHRLLAGRQRYIGYGAMRKNNVPCGQRGRSYYNCGQRGKANPYRRGCTAITHCARTTD